MNIFYAFLTAFGISVYSIPSIIRISHLKNLTDSPDGRKNHRTNIPTLGGVAVFASLIFSLSFWVRNSDFFEMKFIISSIIIIFFIGIKDDLYHLRTYKKFLAQVLAAFILVHWGDVRLTSFYRLFGIQDIPIWVSYTFSVFTITVIVNAFNLIDGVDWLAAGVAALISFFYGCWFYLVNYNSLSLISFSLLGSLIGFMIYNRTPAKIFLGDTGSLLIGLVLGVLSIKFIEFNRFNGGPYKISSVPAVTIAILIVPLFDLARVFYIRIKSGKSPFFADRNHLHHRLLDLGFHPMEVSGILMGVNATFIVIGVYFCGLKGEMLLAIILGLAVALAIMLEYLFVRVLIKNDGKKINAPMTE